MPTSHNGQGCPLWPSWRHVVTGRAWRGGPCTAMPELDNTEGIAFWHIPVELPRSPGGLARDAWRGIASANCNLLAAGKRGRCGREWGGSASLTVSPRAWEPRGKGKLLFFLRMWILLTLERQNRIKLFSPCPPLGEGGALSSPSPEIEQLPISPGCPYHGRFIGSLDDIGASWNTGACSRERLDTPA